MERTARELAAGGAGARQYPTLTEEEAAALPNDYAAQLLWQRRLEATLESPPVYEAAIRQLWCARNGGAKPSAAGTDPAIFRDKWAPQIMQDMAPAVAALYLEDTVPNMTDYLALGPWDPRPYLVGVLQGVVPNMIDLVAQASRQPAIGLPIWELPEDIQSRVLNDFADDLKVALELMETYCANEQMDTFLRKRTAPSVVRLGPQAVLQAFDDYPGLSRNLIVKTYLTATSNFATKLERLANPPPKPDITKNWPPSNRRLSPSEQRVADQHDYREKYGLHELPEIGTVLSTTTPEEIGQVVLALAGCLVDTVPDLSSDMGALWSRYLSGQANRSLTDYLIPKNHYGRLANPRLVIAPVEPDQIKRWLREPSTVDQEHLLHFVALCDIMVTGLGNQGTSAVDGLLYLRLAGAGRSRMMCTFRPGRPAEGVLQQIMADSASRYRACMSYALRHVFSGGLPGTAR